MYMHAMADDAQVNSLEGIRHVGGRDRVGLNVVELAAATSRRVVRQRNSSGEQEAGRVWACSVRKIRRPYLHATIVSMDDRLIANLLLHVMRSSS